MKLAEIASRLGCELLGSGQVEINGVAGIEEAKEDELTFVSNPKYLSKIKSTEAGAIILAAGAPAASIPVLLSDTPYLTFAKAIELFYQPPLPIPGIHPTATIAESSRLGENYSIGANVVIGEEVRLGDNAVIHPNVTIYPHAQIGQDFVAHSHAVVREHCRLGDRVVLQNGAVVGADGFGFAPQQDGSYYKMRQAGIAVLEDDVEVGGQQLCGPSHGGGNPHWPRDQTRQPGPGGDTAPVWASTRFWQARRDWPAAPGSGLM